MVDRRSARLTGFVGMNVSYHVDVQSGPSIVLVGAALFAIAFVVTGAQGRRRAATLRTVP